MGLEAAAIAATASYFAISSTAATALVIGAEIAVSVGLSYGAQLLAPDPASPKAGGKKDRPSVGTQVPRCLVIGRMATAGSVVHDNVYGNDKRQLQVVYALGDHECQGLVEVVADGTTRNLTGGSPSGNNNGVYQVSGYNGHFEVRWFKGLTTQQQDSELVNRADPSGWWTNSHDLKGIAYVSCTLEYRAKEFPSKQPPTLLWVLDGAKLYDPRKDGTQPGGSGAHRFNDPTTWQFSANPYVALYHYMRGYYVSGELWVGAGWAADELDLASFMAAMNACDQNVTRPDGSHSDRYSIAAIWNGGRNADHRAVLDQVMLATGGSRAIRRGKLWVQAGVAVTPVATITDADLAPGEPIRMSDKRPAGSGLINEIYATYLSPDRDWQMKEIAPIKDASALAEDGRRLETSVDFDCVTDRYQARQLMRQYLRQSRKQWNGQITLGPKFIGLEAGDVIRWTTSKWGGWTKDFVIVNWQDRDDDLLNVTLTLQETDASIWDDDTDVWTPSTKVAPNIPADTGAPASLAGASAFITGANGKRKSALDITWTPPDDHTVDAMVVQVRRQGTTRVVPTRIDDAEDGAATISAGVGASGTFEFRASYIFQDQPKDRLWTSWVAVTMDPDDIGTGAAGVNRLYNSALRRSTTNWGTTNNTTGLTWTLGRNESAAKQLLGGNTLYIAATGTPSAATVVDIRNTGRGGNFYPVKADETYEVSGLVGVVNCTLTPVVVWYDDTGATISTSVGTAASGATGGKKRADYVEAVTQFTAPALAAVAEVRFRATMTGGANPRGYVTEPYFGDGDASQTTRSKWSEGSEELAALEVDGSQIATAAVDTIKVADHAITNVGANYISGGVTISAGTGTYTQFRQFNVSRTAGTVLKGRFSWSIAPDPVGPGGLDCDIRIFRDAVLLYQFDRSFPVQKEISTGYTIGGEMFVDFDDTNASVSGSTNYSIEMRGIGTPLTARRRWCEFQEFKR